MIKVKPTNNLNNDFTSYRMNMFNEKNIGYNYNSMYKNFDILLTKLIRYKNRDVYFSSINSLIGIITVEVRILTEHEIRDFIGIFNCVFDIFDTTRTEIGGWYHYINQDISDIEGLTLHQFHQMINSNKYVTNYFRKVKLKKLSEL